MKARLTFVPKQQEKFNISTNVFFLQHHNANDSICLIISI